MTNKRLLVFATALLLVPIVFGQVITEQQKLTASDAQAGDLFGSKVAIDGNTIIVGSPEEDSGGSNAGAAYVFTRSGTTWTEQQKLTASDAQAGDLFGDSVDIYGDTVVVGAEREGSGGSNAGAAYVFTRSGTTWTEQQKLTASDAQAGDLFGQSVAIYEDTIVIGARGEDAGGADAGAAYVFTRSGTTWTEQQKLTASDAAAGDDFGFSASIYGETIIIGAQRETSGGSNAGAAYVFTRSGTTWTEEQKLTASDAAVSGGVGLAVSIDGETVAIGASDGINGFAGAVYVFTRSGTTWTEQQKLTASDGEANDNLGISVSISADSIIAGALQEDDGGADAGAAYVFTRSATTWTEQQKLTASDAQAGDLFGLSTSIDGDIVLVGASREDESGADAGAAYVFSGVLGPPPDPPQGLRGEVVRTGGTSTTGKVDLTWTLSPDDLDQDVGTFDYNVYVNGSLYATDTITTEDGGGGRTFSYLFSGSSSFGNATFNITASPPESEFSCSITLNLDTLGATDSCGTSFTLIPPPAEFDEGLISTLESVGIITVQSKMLFTLVAVGVSTVGMAGALRFMAPGRMKNYVILAIPVLLAILMIFMDFLTPWEFIVALVLGVFATLRMSVLQNTYHELRDRLFQARMGTTGLVDRFRPSRNRDVIDLQQGVNGEDTGDGDGEA